MTQDPDQEIDMDADVDLEIKVSNGWWSINRLTAINAQKIIDYAGRLAGEGTETKALAALQHPKLSK